MIWEKVPFSVLYLESSRNGIYKSKEFHGNGTKIVNMGELFAHNFINSQEMKRVLLNEKELKRDTLLEGDILFGRRSLVESGAGKSSIVKKLKEPTTFESSIIRIRLDQKRVCPLYYYYWLQSPSGKGAIRSLVSGTNVKGIKSSDLKNIIVPKPPLHIQMRISKILSAYDELIENNLKRIKLLEEISQIIYDEWFICMRFPGHETASFSYSTDLPDGWEYGQIGDLIGFQNGFAFKSSDFKKEGFPVIKIKNIGNNTVDIYDTDFVNTKTANTVTKFKLFEGDLLIAMTGATVGKTGFLPFSDKPCYLNQRVGRFLIDKGDNIPYLYAVIGEERGFQQVMNLASGAAQPNISSNQILSIKCIIPKKEILMKYNSLVQPNFDLILKLRRKNQLLLEARDTLLPGLVTGLIDAEVYDPANLLKEYV